MQPILSPAKSLRRLFLGVFFLPFLATFAHAQSATGTISGRVVDQASGRALQGAVVTVRGSNHSDFTDAEGRYSIVAVPAGAATVDVEYVGLDPQNQLVSVAAGATATLNVALKSAVLQLATFEVKEAARGQALAINQQ